MYFTDAELFFQHDSKLYSVWLFSLHKLHTSGVGKYIGMLD